MKNLIRRRRESKAVCSHCQSPDYHLQLPEYFVMKPEFVCNSCGNLWCYGHDGGIYANLLTEEEKTLLNEWIRSKELAREN